MLSTKPPLTPDETLRRVLRISRFDGRSILIVSGIFALGSVLFGDISGAAIGFLVCVAGAVELRGRALLVVGQKRGVEWLIASQFWLLAVILLYVTWQLGSYNSALARELLLPLLHSPLIQPMLTAAGVAESEMLAEMKSIYLTSYMIAGVLSFCFQGGLALYYRNRRAAVAAALGANDSLEAASGRP